MASTVSRQINYEEKQIILNRHGRKCFATGHDIPEEPHAQGTKGANRESGIDFPLLLRAPRGHQESLFYCAVSRLHERLACCARTQCLVRKRLRVPSRHRERRRMFPVEPSRAEIQEALAAM